MLRAMTKDTSAAAPSAEAPPVACLVFLDEEGLAHLPSREAASLMLAVRTEELALRLAGKGTVLRADRPDFTDRLKLLTGGKGFPEVLVLDRDPEAVRQALGAAGVFGVIRLFFEPSGPVTADLHTTINYKSLTVQGSGFGVQGSGPSIEHRA